MPVETEAVVQVAAIFAIVVVIVIEIKLGRDYTTWAPLLSAIVGYVLPQPVVSREKRQSGSMLHMDPEFNATRSDSMQTLHGSANDVKASGVEAKSKTWMRVRKVLASIWPSLLLLAAAAVWVNIDTRPAAVNNSTSRWLPEIIECSGARLLASQYECGTNEGAVCAQQNGTELILVLNKKIKLSQYNWSGLLFHSLETIKRLPSADCTHKMPLSEADYLVACKDVLQLHFRGHQIDLSKDNWLQLMRVTSVVHTLLLACPHIPLL